MRHTAITWILWAMGLCFVEPVPAFEPETKPGYVVVVSQATRAEADWARVLQILCEKHGAEVMTYRTGVVEALPMLRASFPRYACFVSRPEEVTREFVRQVHQLTRQLDDDPYTDCFWGILTGYDAANALRIARHREPLTIHKVASATEVALETCEEGVWYCELTPGKVVRKEKGGQQHQSQGPQDSTESLVKTLNEYQPDLFITSGHATERDWMIGYRYKNGFFKHQDGKLYGEDTQGRRFAIQSPNPKVYLPIGNCLMGHIDRPDCMALSWMNSGGVYQMPGYTEPTWYGYMGWGLLDYFVEQPGRYTLTEAFQANQHALVHRLATCFPGLVDATLDAKGGLKTDLVTNAAAVSEGLGSHDARGLVFDRDVVAFYGDPAWEARMAPGPLAWEQTLEQKDGVFTFTIQPKRGDRTFTPINTNGTQRGYRPIVHFLPRRICDIHVLQGAELHPVITDDFILIPNPRTCSPTKTYRLVFQASFVVSQGVR